MDAMVPRIYRLGVITCLAVVVMMVVCTGSNEPATPATTVAVGATTQPANTIVLAPTVAASTAAVGVSATCAGQRDALVALYNATDGDNWRGKDNWLSDHPVDNWFGVYAGNNGCIYGLSLRENQLSGEIPSELGNLADLESLDLRVNLLTGEIPPELDDLASLTVLYLSDNQLSGEIPVELGNLVNLEYLSLTVNQLSGVIPSELGDLASLTSLFLGQNQLSGEIPPELGPCQPDIAVPRPEPVERGDTVERATLPA